MRPEVHMNRFASFAAASIIGIVGCGGESEFDSPHSRNQDAIVSGSGGLLATVISAGEIDVTWQSSTQVSGWQVYRSGTASGAYGLITNLPASARGYADTGLSPSTAYCYQVRSWKTTGKGTTYSSFLGPACATTLTPPPPPPPPINAPYGLAAVPVRIDYADPWTSGLALSWTDNSTDEDGFRIERADVPGGPWTLRSTTGPNVTSVLEYGIREEQACFRIVAFNVSSSSASPARCIVPPANPTDLSAQAIGQTIVLAWSDNSAVEDGYAVSRADPSGIWSDVATLPANATTWSNVAVSTDVTYSYRVRALKDGGSSDYSNVVATVLPTSLPAAPSDLGAVLYTDYDGDGWLFLSMWWTDASSNEAGFRIEWSDDAVSNWSVVSAVAANQPSFSDKYDLWYLAGSPISLCYRVIAFNALGDSPPSDVFCTGWGETPQNLVATGFDQQTIDLTWTDVARYESGYDIYRTTDLQTSDWQLVATLAPDSSSYRDTGLAAGQQYWYIVATAYPDAWYDDQYNEAWTCAATLPSP